MFLLPLRTLACAASLAFASLIAGAGAETPKPSAAPTPAPSAAPAVDPAATAVWRQHIDGMGDRGRGERPIVNAEVSGRAFEFFEKYPDERRVSGILFNLTNFGGWIEGPDAPRLARAWREHLRATLADSLARHPWPDNVWAGLHYVAAKNDLAMLEAESRPPDLAALRARIDLVAGRAPTQAYHTFLQQEYIAQLERHAPDDLAPHLRALAASPHADLAALGRGRLAILDLKTRPMELSFTALDGTPVDLAQLRGRVVLVDCWATWCVPCVKELPNIKAALKKWGNKGFSVVGISFDRLPDREKLVAFVKKEELNWPHWFNEKGGANPFGRTYNIRSIPATFLLDRDGRLVTTDTHGPLLEAALQKLLGP